MSPEPTDIDTEGVAMPPATVTMLTSEQALSRREELLRQLGDEHGLSEELARRLAAHYDLPSPALGLLEELDDLQYLMADPTSG
jgi:hypothetical protein